MFLCQILVTALALSGPVTKAPLTPYVPDNATLVSSYQRADALRTQAAQSVYNVDVSATWLDDHRLWYEDASAQRRRFVLFDVASNKRSDLFDHAKVAHALGTALGRTVDARELPLENVSVAQDVSSLTGRVGNEWYKVDLKAFTAEKVDRPAGFGRRGFGDGGTPPVRDDRVRTVAGAVQVRSGDDWTTVSTTGDFERAYMTKDGSKIVAFKLIKGDRKKALLLESSPSDQGTRAVLRERLYDQPGDKLDTYETYVIDVEKKSETKVDLEPILGGGQPWSGPPNMTWYSDGRFGMVDFNVRGYQEYKVVMIDPATASAKTIVDEKSDTFVDTTKLQLRILQKTPELIWRSERDGWGQLYLINSLTGEVENQITKGPWVVRDVLRVDEDSRQIWFTANGREPGQDPYQIQYYRVDFDGSHFVRLTDGDGTHTATFSPGYKYLTDTWSRVDKAPVHQVRDAKDGRLIADIADADISGLKKIGVHLPERFVAKGRDGVTDIWGIIVRPTFWSPSKTYPVIENIYAGPHDSFVPKRFMTYSSMHALAELGFIVVQIDGMGTDNRGKKFHDYCWHNLKDAGFPDRILWMKAAALKDPTMDLSRVGIYGTSAGGQESTAGLLFHPEFYKVGVSSCGCHDNRIDKYWWNEQWMGYPVGPWYSESSNIDNAAKLQGHLMLFVGELDTNVPPESTYRLVDALIKANKDFDFLVLPGSDHTSGGAYGEHKRRDFFVKWLLGVDPPQWSELQQS